MRPTVKELLERPEKKKRKVSKNFYRAATEVDKERVEREEEKALELRNRLKARKE